MSERHRHYVREILATLDKQLPRSAQVPWALRDIVTWCPSLGASRILSESLRMLVANGLIERAAVQLPRSGFDPNTPFYLLTPAGIVAVEAARKAARRTARLAAGQQVPGASDFAQRLWNLLRMRQILTAADAAQLLTDAGGSYAQAQDSARRYLRAWARCAPHAVQVGTQRLGSSLRYVLVVDLGPRAPAIGRKGETTGAGESIL